MILRIDPQDLPSAGGVLICQDLGFITGAELGFIQGKLTPQENIC
jgi:hypothetical protein